MANSDTSAECMQVSEKLFFIFPLDSLFSFNQMLCNFLL